MLSAIRQSKIDFDVVQWFDELPLLSRCRRFLFVAYVVCVMRLPFVEIILDFFVLFCDSDF